jgi:hypothetical protein
MNPDVAFGMKLRRLFDSLHSRNFGQYLAQQTCFVQQLKSAPRRAFRQQFRKFIPNPLSRNLSNFVRVAPYRIERCGFNAESKAGRKAHRA